MFDFDPRDSADERDCDREGIPEYICSRHRANRSCPNAMRKPLLVAGCPQVASGLPTVPGWILEAALETSMLRR